MVSLPGALRVLTTAFDITEPEQRAAGTALTGAALFSPGAAVVNAVRFHQQAGIDPRDYDNPQNYAEDVIEEVYDFDEAQAEVLLEELRERGVV